jgi:pimeloyl-ACP methyl ester carboxylesterase
MSDAPPDWTPVPQLAAWLLEGVDAAGIEEAVIGGFHTGCAIALDLATQVDATLRFPAAILSGVPLMSDERRASLTEQDIPNFPLDDEASQFADARERYRRMFPSNTLPWLQHLYVMSTLSDPERQTWLHRSSLSYDVRPALARFPNPILVLNTPEDMFGSTDVEVPQINPHAELAILDGIGAHLPLRDAQAYVTEAFAFLERHDLL